ncbi:hypothetical protein [Thalassorhabdomicrobium marinisediminis]|uniref:Secreted protein n=1 Tax=Thalassorhabdomicrobium marinisediminis TaxID=2170577 RepID=A0A2T7G070_9RHOB|nr:hypothetical protein [Thalassorhabdomicrobium marinisediminis]PVA07814.1 hypothetical protein DC363_04110 [Thalassorhabdomicrobium marinisediminis]
MTFKTLIAAAALATASTVAAAENVTTATGDVVMIEKNQVIGSGVAQLLPFGFGLILVAAATAGGTD